MTRTVPTASSTPAAGRVPPALRRTLWRAGYGLIAVGPLLLSLVQLDPGRGFWVNLSVAAGFVALALLGLQFVVAARWPRATTPFGADVVLQFHRQVTGLILLLSFGHPLVLLLWDSRFLSLLDPVTAPWRARFAVLSVLALLALALTSAYRTRLGLSYPAWQALHAGLAIVVVAAALAHVLMIGYYVDQPWERALWVLYSVAFVWIGFYVRVLKPLGRVRRRMRVVSVTEEAAGCHALELEPVSADAARAVAFAPGQFAWILVGRSPFALTYHPFSFASSAEDRRRLRFVIRSYGPWTAGLHDVRPGTPVYVDGPWGHFSPDRLPAAGWVLIAGGVGITPMLSVLLTRRDRGDRRPVRLFCAARDEASIISSALLEALGDDPDVTVVPVLSAPDENWTGERGHVRADVLRRHLPEDLTGWQCYVCGPDAMMDAAETAAVAAGLEPAAVHTERFVMV